MREATEVDMLLCVEIEAPGGQADAGGRAAALTATNQTT